MKICVSGASSASLALARAGSKLGLSVSVLERSASLEALRQKKQSKRPILIPANGVRALDRLGVPVAKYGNSVQATCEKDKSIFDQRSSAGPWASTTQGDLIEALAKTEGVDIEWGKSIHELEQNPDDLEHTWAIHDTKGDVTQSDLFVLGDADWASPIEGLPSKFSQAFDPFPLMRDQVPVRVIQGYCPLGQSDIASAHEYWLPLGARFGVVPLKKQGQLWWYSMGPDIPASPADEKFLAAMAEVPSHILKETVSSTPKDQSWSGFDQADVLPSTLWTDPRGIARIGANIQACSMGLQQQQAQEIESGISLAMALADNTTVKGGLSKYANVHVTRANKQKIDDVERHRFAMKTGIAKQAAFFVLGFLPAHLLKDTTQEYNVFEHFSPAAQNVLR